MRQKSPLAARAVDEEDGVQHVAHRRLVRAAAGGPGDQRFDERPLLVGQVAGVSLGSHKPIVPSRPPLSDRLLEFSLIGVVVVKPLFSFIGLIGRSWV